MNQLRWHRILGFIILSCGALVMLIPFIWMLLTALKTNSEALQMPPNWLPQKWQWANYQTAWHAAPFTQYFVNSLIVTTLVTIGQLGIAILAAYAFAHFNFYGKWLLFGLCLGTLLIPGELLLIPNFVTISQLHWLDSYQALVVPSLANFFCVLVLKQAFEGVPQQIYQAAKLDGAGDWRCLCQVVLPMTRSSIMAVGLLQMIASWNAFMWPLIVTNTPQYRTLPIGLQSFTVEVGTNYPLLMAASTLVMLPMVLVYLVGQKQLLHGLSKSGLKG